jgi:hypothetical protein
MEGDVTCIDTLVFLCYILQFLIIQCCFHKTGWPSEGRGNAADIWQSLTNDFMNGSGHAT